MEGIRKTQPIRLKLSVEKGAAVPLIDSAGGMIIGNIVSADDVAEDQRQHHHPLQP